jgi:hypothetical protein
LEGLAEIREHAERRGGELMEQQRKAGLMKRGKSNWVAGKPKSKSLKDRGIETGCRKTR